jgi:hypothetical protein
LNGWEEDPGGRKANIFMRPGLRHYQKTPGRAWIVDLEKGNYHLITHLEVDEAYQCLEGKECVTLGFKIAHMVEYMKKR